MSASGSRSRTLLPKKESEAPSSNLGEVVEGEAPLPKRRCISNACEPCRKRKTKCDGAKPSCSTCTTIYKSECYYDIDNDNRRKGALRKSIRQLEAHSEDLETILDGIKEGSEADADDIVHLIRTNEDEPYESIAESIRQMHVTPLNEAGAPILKGELIHLGLSSQENVHQTRHYGHTSAFAFVKPEPEISKTAAGQSETWTTVTNDWEFVKHLLFLYFTWAHPFYVLFDEEIFWHGYENQKLKYCSPLLLNAILALACNYSDRPETRSDPTDPKTVGNHFFAEAKRLLAEDERSCLTTVQALGVMSIRQAMNNHDSSGWLYRGKMMAMAVEMGLHLTYNGPPTKDLSPAEVEVRRITFWGCFVLETAWAISVGRISALPRTAIQLEKPVLTESLEGKIWMPYTDDNTPQFLSKYAQPKLTYNVLNQLSLLSEIVSDTVQMFYAPREPTTSRRLLQHHSRFQQWYSNLPMLLAVRQDAPTLPQILSLHIYYHNCVSHLFRPFVRVRLEDSAKPTPRQICSEEANMITYLMKQYFMTYGLRRAFFINTHCIASAAIIHLLNMSSQEEFLLGALKAAASLLDDIKILKEMHVAYPIVPVLLKAIRCLAVQWKINLPPDIREALETTDTPSPPVCYKTSRAIRPEGLALAKNSAQTSVGASPSAVYNESTAAIEKEDYSAPDAYSTPDFLQMPPQPRGVGLGSPQPYLFTPFGPENLTGLPLRPPQDMPNAAFMGIDHHANNTNIRNNNIHLPVCNSAWDLSHVGFEMNTDDFFPSQWADWDQPEGSGGY